MRHLYTYVLIAISSWPFYGVISGNNHMWQNIATPSSILFICISFYLFLCLQISSRTTKCLYPHICWTLSYLQSFWGQKNDQNMWLPYSQNQLHKSIYLPVLICRDLSFSIFRVWSVYLFLYSLTNMHTSNFCPRGMLWSHEEWKCLYIGQLE